MLWTSAKPMITETNFSDSSMSRWPLTAWSSISGCSPQHICKTMPISSATLWRRLVCMSTVSRSVTARCCHLVKTFFTTHTHTEKQDLMSCFWIQEVETMAMECDHVDILALTKALDVSIHIVSTEGEVEQLAHHVVPEGAEPSLHLLYQTSHYNILYPRPQSWPWIRSTQENCILTLDE